MFEHASPFAEALLGFLAGPKGGDFVKLLLGQAALEHLARVHGLAGTTGDARSVIEDATVRAKHLVERTKDLGTSSERDLVLRCLDGDRQPLCLLGSALLDLCRVHGDEALHAAVGVAARLCLPLETTEDVLPLARLTAHGHVFVDRDGLVLVPCLSDRVAVPEEAEALLPSPLKNRKGIRVGTLHACPCLAFLHVKPGVAAVVLTIPNVRAGVLRLFRLFELYCARGLRMMCTAETEVVDAWTFQSDELHVSPRALRVHDLVAGHVPAAGPSMDPGLQSELERINAAFVAGALRDLARISSIAASRDGLAGLADKLTADANGHRLRELVRAEAQKLEQ